MGRILLGILFFIMVISETGFADDRREKFNANIAIRTSEFVVQAKVVDVAYGMSKGDNGAEILPHTFVTYQVEKVIKGNPRQANDKFVLRFLGGRGEQASFMHPSNYPLFDVGDEDILFIKGNLKASCPLHDCAMGRFRVIQGLMYNERGQEVVLTRKNDIDFAKFQSLPEIMTHKVSQTTIYLKQGPSESEGKPEPNLPIGKHLALSEFANFVQAKVKVLYPPDVLDKWPTIPSADPSVPFFVNPAREMKMRVPRLLPYKPIVPPSESDRFEQSEFEKNQGNPVIKK